MITRWKLVRAALDATSKLLHAHALTDGDEGDDTQAAAEPNATFLQQLGVAARPVVSRTLRALGVEHGDEVLLLKAWDKTKLPAALDEGETQAFACGDVAVRLRLRTTGPHNTLAMGTISSPSKRRARRSPLPARARSR